MMGGGLDGARRIMSGESSKPKNLGATLSRFGGYFVKYWHLVLVVFVLLLIGTWTQIYTPKLIGQATDCYLVITPDRCWFDTVTQDLGGDARLAGIGQVVLQLLGLFLVGAVIQAMAFFTLRMIGENILRSIRSDLFRKFMVLPNGFYAENEAGNLMGRVTSDTDSIQQVFAFGLNAVISAIILLVWIVIEMINANVTYALITLSVVPVMLLATLYFSNEARKAFRRARNQMGSVNADLQESIAGVREVQAFNREEENIEQFRRTNAANRDANVSASAFTSALTPVLEALGFVSIAIVVVVGGISLLRNEPLPGTTEVISIGLVFTFLAYSQRFSQPITQIALLWANIQNAIAGGERIFGLLDTPVAIVDKPDARPMPQIKGHVAFESVSAEYKAGEPVLRGVSFEAQPGDTIAIVGPTGAGKTTIINLLPRFYDVTSGAVKIDGIDVRDVTMQTLREQIGIVLQDTFLFSDTVMSNIRYGRPDATDEDVIAAAKLVAADEFIARLEDGYQTVLGERGAGLSQGQRQLIAIARVALSSPRILILDEATSSVDTRTERVIQRAFETLLEGRTSFVIAHRLSTIRSASMVLMVKDGQIIERGTHNELLAQRGAYYDLYMSQFRAQDTPDMNGSALYGTLVPEPGLGD
ncbi:MAG: ABC transporter ATP-binding protein [Chloroflexota bacterium]|nr:ABC transporter ATP-binding protein [Chloroflexota bacterium]